MRNVMAVAVVMLAFTACSDDEKETVLNVTLSATTLNLSVGATEQLTASQLVTWRSENEEVATVDGTGLVSAVAAGVTVITATTTDGQTATCQVSVDQKWPLRTYFNVVAGYNVEGNGATYAAAYTAAELADPNTVISFTRWGFEVPSVRTARVYASDNGEVLYNLSYGGGTIAKYGVNGGDSYSEIKTLDISLAMGTTNPRWTKVSEEYALMHNVTTEHQYNSNSEYTYTAATAILTAIDLNNFSIITDYHTGGGASFEFPRSEEDVNLNAHVWRIDAPVIQGGKAYYGLNKRGYDPSDGSNISLDYSASSMVVDFPSLTNPKIITSTIGKGSTQGYRTPVAHTDENEDIYQICDAPSYLLKISDGVYDNDYVFDLSAALGMNSVGTNGWFYVGNGIGYLPFYDAEIGSGSAAGAWGVARIDIYNRTAVKINLPSNLWLYQYQYGAIGSDGKFYMAIAPLGGSGNIYIFDPTDTSANGVVKGAQIETMDNTSGYLGIF